MLDHWFHLWREHFMSCLYQVVSYSWLIFSKFLHILRLQWSLILFEYLDNSVLVVSGTLGLLWDCNISIILITKYFFIFANCIYFIQIEAVICFFFQTMILSLYLFSVIISLPLTGCHTLDVIRFVFVTFSIDGEFVPRENDDVTYRECNVRFTKTTQAVHVNITHLAPGVSHETWSAAKGNVSPRTWFCWDIYAVMNGTLLFTHTCNMQTKIFENYTIFLVQYWYYRMAG